MFKQKKQSLNIDSYLQNKNKSINMPTTVFHVYYLATIQIISQQ